MLFSGFNGFRQVNRAERKVSRFKALDCVVSDLSAEGSVLVASAWSYTAIAFEREVLVRGFLGNEPNSVRKCLAVDTVKQICACDRFCLVLLENGQVFKLLPKVDAELEEVKFCVERLAPKRSLFGTCRPEEPLKIQYIACGANITVAISSTNTVYSVPSKIHQFAAQFRVQQLVCGSEHALLLSGNGDIYSWGCGLRGQLGREVLQVDETPILIDALAGIKVIYVAAGGWHSAAISAFGDLYTWGLNVDGAIGLQVFRSTSEGPTAKAPEVYPIPQIIDLPKCACKRNADENASIEVEDCAAAKVFAGARHTVVQMSCGLIYACGWNAHGQLGISDSRDRCIQFEKVGIAFEDAKHLRVICGHWNTFLIR